MDFKEFQNSGCIHLFLLVACSVVYCVNVGLNIWRCSILNGLSILQGKKQRAEEKEKQKLSFAFYFVHNKPCEEIFHPVRYDESASSYSAVLCCKRKRNPM